MRNNQNSLLKNFRKDTINEFWNCGLGIGKIDIEKLDIGILDIHDSPLTIHFFTNCFDNNIKI